ncbi:uncharacterized protein KQ657_002497 [Scheffersomyces spartinae]|uniref:Uncharacterized protein n=1 Tax=Scheffersomyces spartinae TaxID=45513 RepID=A0A9P8AGY6_9ASCO|nr:uncharacterized protein KQ657_002497 [Scheffersomyces spartinae]KAG7192132.1 hypothetical protein KQ657_002497 [Scheffersomyces spartinae]
MADAGPKKPIFKKKVARTSGRSRRTTDIEEDEDQQLPSVLHSKPNSRFQKPMKKKKDISKYINIMDDIDDDTEFQSESVQSLESAIDEGVTIENISELPSDIQTQLQAKASPVIVPPVIKKYVPIPSQREREDIKISKTDLINEYKEDDQYGEELNEDIVDHGDEDDIDATDLMTEGNDKLYISGRAPRLPDIKDYNLEIDDDIIDTRLSLKQLESQLNDITIHGEIAQVTQTITTQKQSRETALHDIASLEQQIMSISHKQELLLQKLIDQCPPTSS